MAETASLARPYAKALFELAAESADYASWSYALEVLAFAASDDALVGVLGDPKTGQADAHSVLISLVGEGAPAGLDNFVKLILRNRRIDALPSVFEQYQEHVAKAQSSITAEVVSARALSTDQRTALKTALEQRLGLSVELQESVDSDLLGGAVVKAGDLVIDGSAKGRLEKLTSALTR